VPRSGRQGIRTIVAIGAIITLAGCSNAGGGEESADPAEAILRDMLESRVIDQSRQNIRDAMGRGVTRSKLAAQIEKQLRLGNISESTACLQKGLIQGLSDDEIVENCRDSVEAHMGEVGGN
jgi:hypothetical protein